MVVSGLEVSESRTDGLFSYRVLVTLEYTSSRYQYRPIVLNLCMKSLPNTPKPGLASHSRNHARPQNLEARYRRVSIRLSR